MRLIDTHNLSMVEFTDSDNVPSYAILSHTWGRREVTYHDFCFPREHTREEKDFSKIEQACHRAREAGFGHIWIDTCCIDKSSSAELSETINSMFSYYKKAGRCYAYLEDVIEDFDIEQGLQRCHWITRGWTLQELIAPDDVWFLNREWQFIGTKGSLVRPLSNLTHIPADVLVSSQTYKNYSVAVRMSWAADRRTTRVEDAAYCLLGIFDVHLPLLYGEGHNAFRRLQEEIIRRTGDLTILACECQDRQTDIMGNDFTTLLARSAFGFANPDIPGHAHHHGLDFSVTNNGLLIASTVRLHEVRCFTLAGSVVELYAITLDNPQPVSSRAIPLRKIGPHLYVRDRRFSPEDTARRVSRSFAYVSVSNIYIVIDPTPAHHTMYVNFRRFDDLALHVVENKVLSVRAAIPHNLWDITDRLFLSSNALHYDDFDVVYALLLTIDIQESLTSFLLIIRRTGKKFPGHKFFLCLESSYPKVTNFLFSRTATQKIRTWTKLLAFEPDIDKLTRCCTCSVLSGRYLVACEQNIEEDALQTDRSPTNNVRVLRTTVTKIDH